MPLQVDLRVFFYWNNKIWMLNESIYNITIFSQFGYLQEYVRAETLQNPYIH